MEFITEDENAFSHYFTPIKKDNSTKQNSPRATPPNSTGISENQSHNSSNISCGSTRSDNQSTNTSNISCGSNREEESSEEVEIEPAVKETEAQKLEREQRESEQLAWEMMRQESMELQELQMQFMRDNANGMSDEDLQALQMAIDESGGGLPVDQQGDSGEEEEGETGEEDEEEDEEEDDVDNWDYDRLLSLGQALGGTYTPLHPNTPTPENQRKKISHPLPLTPSLLSSLFLLSLDVKTERWRLRAKAVISSLPNFTFDDLLKEKVSTSTSFQR